MAFFSIFIAPCGAAAPWSSVSWCPAGRSPHVFSSFLEAGCLANGSPETPLLAQGKQPALRPLRHSSAKCIPAPVACTYESGQRQHLSCLAHGSPETPLLAQLRQAASSQATLPLLRQMQLSQATPPLHCSAPVTCSACVCVCVCVCMHACLQRHALHVI